MAHLSEAIARYHRLLESDPYRDLAWASALQEDMRARHLIDGGRLISSVLRPHFVSRRQLNTLAKAVETLSSILDRLEPVILNTPALLSRLQVLPAEKLLASLPVRSSHFSVTAVMDVHMQNGCMRFGEVRASTAPGTAYADALSDLFLELPLMKEFRKGTYKLKKMDPQKQPLSSVLKAWKEFGGTHRPRIALVEFKQQFAADSSESLLLVEHFRQNGIDAQIVAPDQLEYANGKLRSGEFIIDLVFRRLSTPELLVRYDLSHPLLQAYKEGTVCVVNSFRSDLAQRRAIFELLTDDSVTAKLSSADRRFIHEFIPWTRLVAHAKVRRDEGMVDLPDYILKNREQLVLRPNTHSAEERTYIGGQTSPADWDRALRNAFRTPYVVQEAVPLQKEIFPVYQYGDLQMRELEVSVQPHVFSGSAHGVSAQLTSVKNGVSYQVAAAPVFVLEDI